MQASEETSLGVKSAPATRRIAALFAQNPDRFAQFSRGFGPFLLDFSKTTLETGDLASLLHLARQRDLEKHRAAMFVGEAINPSEGRAVLHTALRDLATAPLLVNGENIRPEIHATRQVCFAFAEGVRQGYITGHSGNPFTDIVNIGIGGSDLGPAMACAALAPWQDGPRVHFVSNLDAAHLADTLHALDPATTLFLIASKTFTTLETMTNAHSARAWLSDALGESAIGAHFVALSTAQDKARAFGITEGRIFGFREFVGGRYSVWSSIGLSLMIAIGADAFQEFLAGAHALDQHFCEAPLHDNLPVLLALVGYWHRRVCGYPARVLAPYAQRLHRFPAYVQQLDMESNGKSVTAQGKPITGVTGPLVFGEPGTNGQHAYFQWLHQGSDITPVEFILVKTGEEPALAHHQRLLLANGLAQAQALMQGRSFGEAGGNPHRVFAGNRPSLTLVLNRLDPYTLGALMALFEQRIFVESVLYGVNAFDQWGVELGKELALSLDRALQTGEGLDALDGSTAGLIQTLRA